MKIEDLKQARISHNWDMYVNSLRINEIEPDLKSVSIKIRIEFHSAVCDPIVKEFQRELTPQDKLYLHYDCVNKDCTSFGFDLTNYLDKAIRTRKSIFGELNCSGKEDWKYINASGCSCQSTINYIIEPKFD